MLLGNDTFYFFLLLLCLLSYPLSTLSFYLLLFSLLYLNLNLPLYMYLQCNHNPKGVNMPSHPSQAGLLCFRSLFNTRSHFFFLQLSTHGKGQSAATSDSRWLGKNKWHRSLNPLRVPLSASVVHPSPHLLISSGNVFPRLTYSQLSYTHSSVKIIIGFLL